MSAPSVITSQKNPTFVRDVADKPSASSASAASAKTLTNVLSDAPNPSISARNRLSICSSIALSTQKSAKTQYVRLASSTATVITASFCLPTGSRRRKTTSNTAVKRVTIYITWMLKIYVIFSDMVTTR